MPMNVTVNIDGMEVTLDMDLVQAAMHLSEMERALIREQVKTFQARGWDGFQAWADSLAPDAQAWIDCLMEASRQIAGALDLAPMLTPETRELLKLPEPGPELDTHTLPVFVSEEALAAATKVEPERRAGLISMLQTFGAMAAQDEAEGGRAFDAWAETLNEWDGAYVYCLFDIQDQLMNSGLVPPEHLARVTLEVMEHTLAGMGTGPGEDEGGSRV